MVLGFGLVQGFEYADVDVVGGVGGEHDGGGGFGGVGGDLLGWVSGVGSWRGGEEGLTSRTCFRWVMEGVGMIAGVVRKLESEFGDRERGQ